MARLRKWTEPELTLALYAYCNVPFKNAHDNNPWIVKVANVIGRTPAAVKMKIGNFGTFDPALKAKGIVGLSGTSQLDEVVWNRYYGHWDNLAQDAQRLLGEEPTENHIPELPKGEERMIAAKCRVNQDFFRHAVLASYNFTCCISLISNPKLLEACHIIGWSEDESIRTDPTNGLCLNPLFHKAYDQLLMSITPDYRVTFSEQFSSAVNDEKLSKYISAKNGTAIRLPDKFLPNPDYLANHYERYLKSI